MVLVLVHLLDGGEIEAFNDVEHEVDRFGASARSDPRKATPEVAEDTEGEGARRVRGACPVGAIYAGTSGKEQLSMDGRAVDITEQILGAAIAVHRALGPGLLESTYEACLAFELIDRGLPIVRQAALPVVYRGVRSLPVHEAQILTYLKLSGLPVALLLNFNVPLMKQGIKRFVGHPAV